MQNLYIRTRRRVRNGDHCQCLSVRQSAIGIAFIWSQTDILWGTISLNVPWHLYLWGRGDHFWFGSVFFFKKQPNWKEKKKKRGPKPNRDRSKPTGFGSVWVRFLRSKTEKTYGYFSEAAFTSFFHSPFNILSFWLCRNNKIIT